MWMHFNVSFEAPSETSVIHCWIIYWLVILQMYVLGRFLLGPSTAFATLSENARVWLN